jgi:simple sugar transport system ATP-binding protein/ribose transport system ATP-binding protein
VVGLKPVVEAVGLTKRFGATRALDDVDAAFAAGEVHALVGENGAGKSTLGKIISGVYKVDEGSVLVDGAPVGRWDPMRAQQQGIVMIAQELSLVGDRTVAENVFLGREPRAFGVLKRGLDQRFAELEERCRFGLDGRARVGSLRIADQQKVEIMRALAREARVIVMDEPTSALTADEAAKLHDVIAWLREEGRTVIYVTHFLDAVLEHCDRVTIMRDGRVVRTSATAEETKPSIVEAMLGRALDTTFPARPPAPGTAVEPLLELHGVGSGELVHGVDLEVRPGEVVGLAGLVGSGRSEIARTIFGADPLDAGEVVIGGRRLTRGSPRRSVRDAVALIPEDRRAQGLCLGRPVGENITLPHLHRFARAGVIAKRRERRAAAELVERLNVQPPRLDGDVAGFSGGNQQKVLFAKWMLGEPRVVILDEPTRGVDIGNKQRIYELVGDLARSGAAVLLISSELEEVVELSHRVYLVRDGSVVGEVDPAATTADDILRRLFEVAGRPSPDTEVTDASR